MAFDPVLIIMLALIGLLIFLMFRNGKKQKEARDQLQNNLRPGVEVMLGSGIYGTVVSIDEASQRVILNSAGSEIEAHLGAVSQIVPAAAAEETPEPAGDSAAAETDSNQ